MGGAGRGSSGGGCSGCLTRTPHATLIALIMCWAGVAVFCGTMYRGVNLSLRVLQVRITMITVMRMMIMMAKCQDVFRVDRGIDWVEPTQLAFVILGASMAAVGLMILVSRCGR